MRLKPYAAVSRGLHVYNNATKTPLFFFFFYLERKWAYIRSTNLQVKFYNMASLFRYTLQVLKVQ